MKVDDAYGLAGGFSTPWAFASSPGASGTSAYGPIASFLPTSQRSLVGNSQAQGSSMLQDLYKRIMGMNPVTTVLNNTIQTQQQNRSHEFEASADAFVKMLNELASNTQQAYTAKQGTYADLIRSLSNIYGARGGAASGAAQSSALSSGLTPLEASGAGNEAMLANLQQFFPALAGLKGEAADVGINLQSALAGLQQQLNLPFISSVLSPYQRAVAGTTTTDQSTQTTTDPMQQMSLLSQLAQAVQTGNLQQQQLNQGDALGWAQLAAQIEQAQASNKLGWGGVGANLQSILANSQLGWGQLGLNKAQGEMGAEQWGKTFDENRRQWDLLNDPDMGDFDDWKDDNIDGPGAGDGGVNWGNFNFGGGGLGSVGDLDWGNEGLYSGNLYL